VANPTCSGQNTYTAQPLREARRKERPGIVGSFFKSDNPQQLHTGYKQQLGILPDAHGQKLDFPLADTSNSD
jgi:hypothetical protein